MGFGGSGSSGSGSRKGESSALVEVKSDRTLAIILRSEMELLSKNEEQQEKIVELNLAIEEKNKEVEKLKDPCLKQREEINGLKSAIMFPDVINSQLQGHLGESIHVFGELL